MYREQGDRCRDLARLADELRRRLDGMATEYEARAQEAEELAAKPLPETKRASASPLKDTIQALTLSIKDAGRLLGLGRSTIYRLIGEGQLDTVKIGNRTLIKTASIRRLVEQD